MLAMIIELTAAEARLVRRALEAFEDKLNDQAKEQQEGRDPRQQTPLWHKLVEERDQTHEVWRRFYDC